MRIIAMLSAGALAAATFAAVPAEAQRYGYQDHRGGSAYSEGYRDGRRDARLRDGRGYRHDRRWRNGRRYYAQPRVTCRWVRTPRGRQQRCYRI